MTELELHAMTPAGPRRLEVPAGAAAQHELYADLELGVYSGLRTYEHTRFLRLEDHLERTQQSCGLLGLVHELDHHGLRRALHELCGAWPGADSRVRFDVLAAPVRALGIESRVVIALGPLLEVPDELRREGARVQLSGDITRPDPVIKRAEFVERRIPYLPGTPEAYETIMTSPEGDLLEGTSTNFFAVRDGHLLTAPAEVLEGITRRIVLELAEEARIPTRLAPVSTGDIPLLHEAFVTSSSREIVPVVAIGQVTVGSGRVGPLTRRLLSLYRLHARLEACEAI